MHAVRQENYECRWYSSAPDKHVHIYKGDISSSALKTLRMYSRVRVDIETTGPDRESLLDFKRGRPALVTLRFEDFAPILLRPSEDGIPDNLCSFLELNEVEKVFHHAPFDMSFMMHAWNTRIKSVACTRLAAKMLGFDAPMRSLAPQVKHFLNIDMPKGQAISDWTAPELSNEQIAYAVDDVEHLGDLLDAQTLRMSKPMLEEYQAFCDFLPTYVWHMVHGLQATEMYVR